MSVMLRKAGATVIAVAGPITLAIGYLATRGSVPDPLPTHWSIRGEVDSTAGLHGYFLVTMVIAAVLAIGTLACIWLTHTAISGRMAATFLTFGTWITGATVLVTLVTSSGADTAQRVSIPGYAVALVIVIPAVIAALQWLVLPGRWPAAPVGEDGVPSTLTLAPGEAVTWIDHQHSAVLYGISALLAVVGAVLFFAQMGVGIALFAAALITALFCELAVRIDARGVVTLWGPFGWPRQRIALADIAGVRAERIRPSAWGGWGYRVSPRGVAAIIRGGPGLVIDRVNKPTYVVTVPKAADGADVLNALLNRARRDWES